MADTNTPFDWKHIEQHHYECNWHGYRLMANQDIWKVEHDGLLTRERLAPVAGGRIAPARHAQPSRSPDSLSAGSRASCIRSGAVRCGAIRTE